MRIDSVGVGLKIRMKIVVMVIDRGKRKLSLTMHHAIQIDHLFEGVKRELIIVFGRYVDDFVVQPLLAIWIAGQFVEAPCHASAGRFEAIQKYTDRVSGEFIVAGVCPEEIQRKEVCLQIKCVVPFISCRRRRNTIYHTSIRLETAVRRNCLLKQHLSSPIPIPTDFLANIQEHLHVIFAWHLDVLPRFSVLGHDFAEELFHLGREHAGRIQMHIKFVYNILLGEWRVSAYGKGANLVSHIGNNGFSSRLMADFDDGLHILLPASRNALAPAAKQPASRLNVHLITFSVVNLALNYRKTGRFLYMVMFHFMKKKEP